MKNWEKFNLQSILRVFHIFMIVIDPVSGNFFCPVIDYFIFIYLLKLQAPMQLKNKIVKKDSFDDQQWWSVLTSINSPIEWTSCSSFYASFDCYYSLPLVALISKIHLKSRLCQVVPSKFTFKT